MWRFILLVGPALAAGLALTVTALGDRDQEPLFVLEQQGRSQRVDAESLARTIRAAPEPVAEGRGTPGRSARCTRTGGENDWRCTVRYARGNTITYFVWV